MFADDYVELCGIVDPAGRHRGSRSLSGHGRGTVGAGAAHHRSGATRRHGRRPAWPAAVAEDGRTIDPDVELRSKDVMLDLTATGGVPLFACAPLDPEPLRRPSGCGIPTARVAIGSVTVVVEEPAALVAPMSKVFGGTCLTETDDTLAVHTGRGIMLFATPDDLDMLHPELESGIDPQPTLAALTCRCRDLRADRGRARGHDVAYGRT